jgi:hypothetical protein
MGPDAMDHTYGGVTAVLHTVRSRTRLRQRVNGWPEGTRASACWVFGAQRLKRLLKLDLSIGESCGGTVRVIDSVEEEPVVGKMFAHLETPPPKRVVDGWRACPAGGGG